MSGQEHQSPRDGSSLYYSCLYLAPGVRDRCMRRLALTNEISGTLYDVSEPQVARQKIHWWHEELDRLLQGASRHPATQAVGNELQGLDCARDRLIALLGVAADQRLLPLATEAERQVRVQKQADAGIRLVLHAVSGNTSWLDTDHTVPASLARAHGEMDQLLQLPRLVHRGLAVFSEELYQRFDLSPAALARQVAVADPDVDADTGSIKSLDYTVKGEQPARRASIGSSESRAHTGPLFKAATVSALQAFEQTDAAWSVPAGTAPGDALPLRILSALRARQCRLWLKREPDLLRERASLPPLHKLYIAWRCKRRFAHGPQS